APARPRAATGGSNRSMKSNPRAGRAWCAGLVLAAAALFSGTALGGDSAGEETIPERDRRLITAALEAMPAQRPGQPDLYVVGFAGDGNEDVFRNEVLYLEQLMDTRFQTQGRVIGL